MGSEKAACRAPGESTGPPPDPNDAWSLFDPRHKAEVERFETLTYFALSPSTLKVAYVGGKRPRQVDEIRVYGPEGGLVWFSVPKGRPGLVLRVAMRRLFRKLTETPDRLQKG